ncbi:MAG: metallophosphoesterase family protein [Candidatus Hydrogenedentes bacterium]|nr:metallophosphoesterase family protein [Candidatus Hydrogenedentota bacterium]
MKPRITRRRALIAFFGIVALYFAFREFKGDVIDWYAHSHFVRTAAYVASDSPDQICLTWSDDPRTTQTIQWRTATSVMEGSVEYREGGPGEDNLLKAKADRKVVEDVLLQNDPLNHRFTAVLRDLKPDTTYAYRVGNAAQNTWSEWAEFKTAPEAPRPFSFTYLGDPQKGLDSWGRLMQAAQEQYSSTAFYLIAGDLINDGGWRNEWDHFFRVSRGIFDRRPLVPVLGNHDYSYDEVPQLYLDLFSLPLNGPADFPPERAYSFTYSNALFVVLDSNLPVEDQAPWLEEQLSESTATWKFAAYHHPAFPSAPHRRNVDVRDIWGAIFDKYHVDMALQGHDHAYLRTYPMRGGERAASAKEGTYYVVSVSGTKFYDQEPHDYAEVAFPDVMTYQTIDIGMNPDTLTYRAYDMEGKLRDEVVITK